MQALKLQASEEVEDGEQKGHTRVPSLTNCLGISANSVRRSDMVLMARRFLEVDDVEM